ncbi:MAG: CpsD/CapB family tyrosine-protein kinase [Clostridia bacterium]|nr:CpsD/CapB family tyrosine-protein kinase [Clostridia bacterium]
MSMEPISLNLPGEGEYFTQEAYKTLRTNIQFCGKNIKVIAITSVSENEGKSTVSLHIGKSFAELGKKVLVIDADMRKSVIAGRNTTADTPSGLSELLTGLKEKEDCFYPVKDLSMEVIFSGPYPPNPVELLNSDTFAKMIKEARSHYDYIIIDTPPLREVIDAAVVATRCDGVIMVLGSTKVHYNQAQELVEQIEKSGCKMLGVVLNHRKRNDKRGYYRKKYYKAYGATEEKAKK